MQLKYSLRWFVCLFLAVVYASCANDTTGDKDVTQKLLELERQAIEKEFKNDTSFLSSIMDSTFIELSKEGLKNKHEVLKTIFVDNVQNEKNHIERDSFQLNEPVVHNYGNAAVVTFIIKTFNKRNDSSFTRRTRFYDVWIKRGNEWKAVTWQGSPLDY